MTSLPGEVVKRVLREPLFHFLILGSGLFVAYGLMPERGDSLVPEKIVVTAAQVELLAGGFAKISQRPPSDAELAGLIDAWVRDEVSMREAMALGLDNDDTVIRRRLRQKLEFVSEGIAARTEPTDADLDAYLEEHAASFRIEPRLTFSHVYLDPAKHGDHLARDAARVLAELKRLGGEADLTAHGDSSLLDHSFQSMPAGEVAKQFGEEFAAALGRATPGRWEGPIESGYGAHLVLVRERTESRLPALPEVRDAVLRELANARRQEANERFYRELLKRYAVTIEKSGSATP